MDRIETQSTSRNTATTSDIVLREGPQSRLLFRPEIVDNTGKPEAAVKGRFGACLPRWGRFIMRFLWTPMNRTTAYNCCTKM